MEVSDKRYHVWFCGLTLVVVAMGAVVMTDRHDWTGFWAGGAQIIIGAVFFSLHLWRLVKP